MGTASAPVHDTGLLAAVRGALEGLSFGDLRYDLSVPAQLLHPQSSLQMFEALVGAPRLGGDTCVELAASHLDTLRLETHLSLRASRFSLHATRLTAPTRASLSESERHLAAAAAADTSEARMLGVVCWVLSTARHPPFLRKPYNPVLGETHCVHGRESFLLVEQVSHHPPVTAFCHGLAGSSGAILCGAEQPRPRFTGLNVEVARHGAWVLELPAVGETYLLNAPSLSFRLLPTPGAEWVSAVHIACAASGLQASIHFHPRLLPGTPWHCVSGNVSRSDTGELLHEFKGRWTGRVMARATASGIERQLFDASSHEDACQPQMPLPLPHEFTGVGPVLDSRCVWASVTEALQARSWETARAAKTRVEEAQRERRSAREDAGLTWAPRFFEKLPGEGGWALKRGADAALKKAFALSVETGAPAEHRQMPESHRL